MAPQHRPHILTIDLEDWFHCLEPNPRHWHQFERRIEVEADCLLELLDRHLAKATFFVLGDVAERSPHLIQRIAGCGHEIGTHGMLHEFVYRQTPDEFREDLQKSLRLLEAIVGTAVRAYRAPYFSITRESLWALQILFEEGIRYDSSIFPIRNPRYGIPGARRTPHLIERDLWECPVSVLPTPCGNIPFAGGVYQRFLPWRLIELAVGILERRREPVIVYLHPWELDPGQPRHKTGSRFLRFRHYYGLRRTCEKLTRLLQSARYVTLAEGIGALDAEGSERG